MKVVNGFNSVLILLAKEGPTITLVLKYYVKDFSRNFVFTFA